MKAESKVPDKIFPVDYAGFWDFSIDGLYGDSILNVVDFPNAEQIANEISKRYNSHEELLQALEENIIFLNWCLKERLEFSGIENDTMTAEVYNGIKKFEALRKKIKF